MSMRTYMVDFYPKPAHTNKDLGEFSVRVSAADDAEAKKIGRCEMQSEHPELNLSQFEIEVSELLHQRGDS